MKNKVFLGYTKVVRYGLRAPIYLENFTWDCDWYWAGGYLGNKNCHFHFDGAFLDTPDRRGHPLGSFCTPWDSKEERERSVVLTNGCSIWENITTFLDEVPEHLSQHWWRIKDLFKQFYKYREAAECAKLGGHCTSSGRSDKEIRPRLNKLLNLHLLKVIIPEIHAVCEFYDSPTDAENFYQENVRKIKNAK